MQSIIPQGKRFTKARERQSTRISKRTSNKRLYVCSAINYAEEKGLLDVEVVI